MKPNNIIPRPDLPSGMSRTPHPAGTYIACSTCGRLLKIEWAVRSLICSCGARVKTRPPQDAGE
jgi:DNA-directed RNA polymerase subunit RPC12/RpoP